MSETGKSALLLHEGLYRMLRVYGETNSILTRHAVAHALAAGEFEDVNKGLPDGAWRCLTDPEVGAASSAIFHAYNDADGNLVFQFDFINGKPVLTRTATEIDMIPVDQTSELVGDVFWTWLHSNLGNTGFAVQFSTTDVKTMTGELGFGAYAPTTLPFSCSQPF